MSRYERRIFPAANFEDELALREHFGWTYVGQRQRSKTIRANHVGGGVRFGRSFAAGGTTTYETVSWTDIEMARDRHQPNYADLVECEQAYDAAFEPSPPRFHSVWFQYLAVPLVLVGIGALQFVGPLEGWFQRATVDWREWQLSLLAIGCIPLVIVLGGLLIRLGKHLERHKVARFDRLCAERSHIRATAFARASRLRQAIA